jgi:hypothetical protein
VPRAPRLPLPPCCWEHPACIDRQRAEATSSRDHVVQQTQPLGIEYGASMMMLPRWARLAATWRRSGPRQ